MRSFCLVFLFLSSRVLAQNATDAPTNASTTMTDPPTPGGPTLDPLDGSATDAPTEGVTTSSTGSPTSMAVTSPPGAATNTSAPSPAVTDPPPTPFPTYISNIDYLDDPIMKWSVQLPETGSTLESKIGTGNAVTVSPENSLVYVTLDDGRLEVLSASDGSTRWQYTPPPLDSGWTVRCQSGVYFGEQSGTGKFAIYAIIDQAPSGSLEDNKSRVVAVSHPGNELLWISESVPGEIQGTPVTSFFGKYIFFTHNQNVGSITESVFGSFSILQADQEGSLMFTEDAGNSPSDPDPSTTRIGDLKQPYGPVGVSHSPVAGRYLGGENNLNDIIVWSTSTDDGRGGNGYTRAFQIPRLFQPEFAASLETTFLREVRWNAVARPVLSQDGLNLVFGVRSNSVRGWTGFNDYYENGNIVQTLTVDATDDRQPVQKAPAFSTSETRFFVASSVPVLNALATHDGRILWEYQGEAEFASAPKASPDDKYVYSIQGNGKVVAHDQKDGSTFWEFDCTLIPMGLSCENDVKGEFSLSPNGLVLYYGDYFGNVKAIRLGASMTPTVAPTAFPTKFKTAAPSVNMLDSNSTSLPESNYTVPPTGYPSAQMVSTGVPTMSPIGNLPTLQSDPGQDPGAQADVANVIPYASVRRALGTIMVVIAIVFV